MTTPELPPLPVEWQERLRKAHPNSDPQYWPDQLMFKYALMEITEWRVLGTAGLAARGPTYWITTAYEQGFGHAHRSELSNPYPAGKQEHEAWDLGRAEGLRKPREYCEGTAARAPMTEEQAKALLKKHDIPAFEFVIDAILEASRGLTREQVLALVPSTITPASATWNGCCDAMRANIEAAFKEAGK